MNAEATTGTKPPADPLEDLARQAEGPPLGQGATELDTAYADQAQQPDPETKQQIEAMKMLATGVLCMGLAKARDALAADLPEFRETCPDAMLQPPAVELVKLAEGYLVKLTEIAGSSTKLAPLAIAVMPILMAYMHAQQLHSAKKLDRDDGPAAG